MQIFLEGLNPEFSLRAQMLWTTPDWSTLDQTISSTLEEETRLENQVVVPYVNVDARAALSFHTPDKSLAVPKNDQANAVKFDYKRTRVICDHCKKPGHIKKKLFRVSGLSSWVAAKAEY